MSHSTELSEPNSEESLQASKKQKIVSCNLTAEKKGKKAIKTTNRALKKHRSDSLKKARAKLVSRSPICVILSPASTLTASGCKQVAVRNAHNKERKSRLTAWQQDKQNDFLLTRLLSLPLQADVLEEARNTECSCARCTLAREHDFMSQKSGLEEVYINHNKAHGTKHYCVFLPKFHPELNPIERAWCRMKWHCRKYCNGKLEDLQTFMDEGLSLDILPLKMIRKFVRLQRAYLIAYKDNLDIVESEAWIKQHKSHRGYAAQMDAKLENLYFPLGRDIQENEPVEETVVIRVEEEEVEPEFTNEEGDDDEMWNGMVDAMNAEDGENFDFRRFLAQFS